MPAAQLKLYIPQYQDLWYRQKLLNDPDTMSYNKGYNEGGGIVTDMGAPVMSDGAEAPDGKLGDYGEINLVFNVGDSPEGVARVVQNITKII